jgi:hypothetical protein
MKIHIGEIQEEININIGGWTEVIKPPIKKWQLLVFPIALFNLVAFVLLWLKFTPALDEIQPISFPQDVIRFLLCLIGLLVVHELIHTIFHPKIGSTKHSIIGLYPSKGLLYSIYKGELSRIHFIIILLMPFFVISVAPLIIAIFTNYYNIWYAYITIANAFVAAGDISEIVMVLKQVPPKSRIKRTGWKYYWKNIC